MTIYTLGYCGWKHDEIENILAARDAVLVDVRMTPRSRAPMWNVGVLQRRFGDRYVCVSEFGNRNYKGTFEQIEIVDFNGGENRLRELAGTGKSVVLMCGCTDVNVCHRKILAEMLSELWGTDVIHLTHDELDTKKKASTQTLFSLL